MKIFVIMVLITSVIRTINVIIDSRYYAGNMGNVLFLIAQILAYYYIMMHI